MRICALGCTKVMHIQYTAGIRTLLFVDCQQVFGLVFQTRAGDQYGNPLCQISFDSQRGGTSVFSPHWRTKGRMISTILK